MTITERFEWFVEHLKKNPPKSKTELHHKNPYQLLVAVILSAQCKDERVNLVTPKFFERYPDALSLSFATFEDVFNLISTITFPNNKATNLIHVAKNLSTFYNGVVPKTISELESLPGVGRKTANVVASVAYNVPALGVDTHVIRLSERLGFCTTKKPLEIEGILTTYIPKDLWISAHHFLVLHGRYICTAKNPKCFECNITDICTINKSIKHTKKFDF